jgi:hypothetical protein
MNLFARDVGCRDISTAEEWTAVLKLSTELAFPTLRTLAIRKLSQLLLSPLDKLVLGRRYDTPDWIQPAVVALCLRPEPLTLVEAERLDLQDVVQIFTLHERVQTKQIPLDTNVVARHVELFFKTSSRDVDRCSDAERKSVPLLSSYNAVRPSSLPNDRLPPSSSSPSTNPNTSPSLPSRHPEQHSSSDATSINVVPAAQTPAAAEFDEETFTALICSANYDAVVDCITKEHCESAVRVLTSVPPFPRGVTTTAILNRFVQALVRRCARQRLFIDVAISALSAWMHTSRTHAAHVRKALHQPTSIILERSVGRVNLFDGRFQSLICRAGEKMLTLTDEEYLTRTRLATEFVREIMKAGLITSNDYCEHLPVSPSKAAVLYDILAVLGPVFDSSDEGKKKLDGALDDFQQLTFKYALNPLTSEGNATWGQAARLWHRVSFASHFPEYNLMYKRLLPSVSASG